MSRIKKNNILYPHVKIQIRDNSVKHISLPQTETSLRMGIMSYISFMPYHLRAVEYRKMLWNLFSLTRGKGEGVFQKRQHRSLWIWVG